ncbi:hypothetical protein [Acuticoccus kandeliae]|uniref:hypothetical protein n=1 Tax=Acuticoccus kandeliae TaxID=2073160 RepID=UPI000D3E42B3|nr:hypothetical protein [Acuticoccus kandeliae]
MIEVFRAMAGLLVWAAAFALLYAIEGYGCSLGWGREAPASPTPLRLALLAAFAVAILAQAATLQAVRSTRLGSASPFFRQVGIVSALAGLVATVWTLFPVAVTSVCL